MKIQFFGLPTNQVQNTKASRRDAYNLALETHVSDGLGTPCRHCLQQVPADKAYLALAWRPFDGLNPYTETGPIFLCKENCTAAHPAEDIPAILDSPSYIVRGYDTDERIAYSSGRVVETTHIPDYAQQLLGDPNIAFVDVRSASNNCFLCRVKRVDS